MSPKDITLKVYKSDGYLAEQETCFFGYLRIDFEKKKNKGYNR